MLVAVLSGGCWRHRDRDCGTKGVVTMTERSEYVEAATEKLTDGEMVERFTHPAHDASEHAGEAGDRDDQTPQAPAQ
jgi:hypothetical protein